MNKSISRLKANYACLADLYKRGAFEDPVPTAESNDDERHFYPFAVEQKGAADGRCFDLKLATEDLRETALYLFEHPPGGLGVEDRKELVLYYYRAIGLSYEVADYFLSVDRRFERLLTGLTAQIVGNFEAFTGKHADLFPPESETINELKKHVLIVSLCGLNQYYREHRLSEALELAQSIKSIIDRWLPDAARKRNRGLGLRGLFYFILGKIHMALGNFDESETAFQRSVERYSESVWRHGQRFSKLKREFAKVAVDHEMGIINRTAYKKYLSDFERAKQSYGLSRDVALRRCALAASFGFGFQALVTGRVSEAIRVSSLARGVTLRNTGKVHRSYVDLIYFSAKCVEESSNRRVLLQIQRNLFRCYRVFRDIIPASHYKNRALFQMGLVKYYIAKYHRAEAATLPTSEPPKTARRRTRLWHLGKAASFLDEVIRYLSETLGDDTLKSNKRLRAESAALMGHALVNLALVEKALGKDGSGRIYDAEVLLKAAWEEAGPHKQIQCEVGLARATVGRAKVEYRNVTIQNPVDDGHVKYPQPADKQLREQLVQILDDSRDVLFKVLALNADQNPRVQGTAYLRLVELSLLRKSTWADAHRYFDRYARIADKIEHEFCRRWAAELQSRMAVAKNALTFTIVPGETYTETQKRLEKYYCSVAVNDAARNIAFDRANDRIKKSGSLSSYIWNALHDNFGVPKSTALKWIDKHKLDRQLRRICKAAEVLPHKGSRTRHTRNGDEAAMKENPPTPPAKTRKFK